MISLKKKIPASSAFSLFLFVLVLVLVCLSFFMLQWSYPYCNVPEDGPVSGVLGFPFPYVAADMGSSLHRLSMPHIFVLNVLLLSVPLYYLFRILLPLHWQYARILKWICNIVSVCVIALYLTIIVYQLNTGWVRFVVNINQMLPELGDGSYFSLRPIRVITPWTFDRWGCESSAFWFDSAKINKPNND